MGKLFGILLIVLGVWAAAEYLGGNSPFEAAEPHAEARNALRDTGSKVQAAYDQGASRLDSLLAED